MKTTSRHHEELATLLESLCEDRLSAADAGRLERLVLADREALRLYLSYIDLHGTLHWDTALGAEAPQHVAQSDAAQSGGNGQHARGSSVASAPSPLTAPGHSARRKRWVGAVAAIAAACMVAVGLTWLVWRTESDGRLRNTSVAESDAELIAPDAAPERDRPSTDDGPLRRRSESGSLALRSIPGSAPVRETPPRGRRPPPSPRDETPAATTANSSANGGSSVQAMVSLIDREIRSGWKSAGVQPSPVAEDAEWMRRVYLDVTGRIPSIEEAERFLGDPSAEKRQRLIAQLLDEPAYVRNWTTIWSNLLIGRSDSRNVDRPALSRFLRASFAKNRPWNDVVYDLVSAEGSSHENGASNFLLAHLNNEAVPATAITARLFLGVHVQCTQCHNHPFNDWTQDQFWELNAFFKQTELVFREEPDGVVPRAELLSRPQGGPIHYETRQGVMRAAFPRFEGETIDSDSSVNRRRALAQLMTEGDNPQIATAFVNRMWEHFFGYGFTRPVDDLGPHNAPSHPELLDRLSTEFVRSGYDVKQLIRWICNSEAYQRTSRFGEDNELDDPAAGEMPLFSRVYVKPMTAEQVYDSLLIATRAHLVGHSSWDEVDQQRQEWLQQFVVTYDNEENTESDLFQGSVPQALMMMNGELVEKALSDHPGTFFSEVIAERSPDSEKIRKLCLSALSREPTDREIALVRKLLRERLARDRGPRSPARQMILLSDGLEDVFWAYLNSNEFVLIH